jgi:hypothetical protein
MRDLYGGMKYTPPPPPKKEGMKGMDGKPKLPKGVKSVMVPVTPRAVQSNVSAAAGPAAAGAGTVAVAGVPVAAPVAEAAAAPVAAAPAEAEAAAAGPGVASSEFDPEDRPTLYQSAAGDFLHDFNEPGRSDVTTSLLNRVPIEYSKTPSKNYGELNNIIVAAKDARTAAVGSQSTTPAQAYWVFRDKFNITVPGFEGVPSVPGVKHEEDILDLAGIPYNDLLKSLTRANAATGIVSLPQPPPSPAPEPAAPLLLGFKNKRPYNVRAAATKVEGQHGPLADIFSGLSGGATVFVLMWDAGAISITRLAEGADGGPYHFFFVRSKENLSDPAGKISVESMRSSERVRVYFLEDEPNHTSQYPFYATGGTTNENLFSNFTLTTQLSSEKPDTVSGTISIKKDDSTTVNISVPDIGLQSEVSETVIKTIHMELNDEPDEEIMPYFFLKRAGDWCQALCLLDRGRKYIVKRAPGYAGAEGWMLPEVGPVRTTIAALEAGGALVAMITLDRIMLAYLVAAGINVFYTNVRAGSTWMIYFENTVSGKVDDLAALRVEAETIGNDANEIIGTYNGLSERITNLPATATAQYIVDLRKLCLLLKPIPSPASVNSTIQTIVDTSNSITEPPNPADVAVLRNGIAKIKTAHASLPGETEPPSSQKDTKLETEMTALFTKIARDPPIQISRNDSGFSAFRSFIDDIRTVKQSAGFTLPPLPFPTGAAFQSTRASSSAESPGDILQQHWNTLVGATGGGRMKGGGASTFDECYSVYAYNDEIRDDVGIAALLELTGAATAAIKSRIVLPDGFIATVVDDILIGPDTEDVLQTYTEGEGEVEEVVLAQPSAPWRGLGPEPGVQQQDSDGEGGESQIEVEGEAGGESQIEVEEQYDGGKELNNYKDFRRVILQYDKTRMDLQRLKSCDALDPTTHLTLFKLAMNTKEIPADFEDKINNWLIENIGYPPLDSVELEDPTPAANAALLKWIVVQEDTILNDCNAEIDQYYRDGKPSIYEAGASLPAEPEEGWLNSRIENILTFEGLRDAAELGRAAEILSGLAQGREDPAPGPSNAAAGVGEGGGLRTRRPLYSNARPTPSLDVDGASKHEGLWERTGARTHRRLRKSSRLTRRR